MFSGTRSFANKLCHLRTFPLPKRAVQFEKFEKEICLKNEPILQYEPGSEELCHLEEAVEKIKSKCEEIPIVINGKEMKCRKIQHQRMPHNHKQIIAQYYHAEEKKIYEAMNSCVDAQKQWDRTSLAHRIKIWEKAADLMATKYRADLVASTMLGQGKTVIQAEIDAAAELIDFIRMNTVFLKEATKYVPISENEKVTRNHLRFRGIDGFIAAVSPFNFTAIGGNLAYTPALMGNAVVWKPSDTAVLSNWRIFQIMREAGVPDGVVNFVPADGPTFGRLVTWSPHLAGINFTGSVPTFRSLWQEVAKNLVHYKNFPRIIGECGGKNFHFVHPSADVETVVASTIRSAFEYSGQKCSACSRLFVPESLWEREIMPKLVEKTKQLIVGDVCDYKTFLSAVIDDKSFNRVMRYIDNASRKKTCKIIAGGQGNNLTGYFIEPTIVVVTNLDNVLLHEEIFGPVLAVVVFKDKDVECTMDFVSKSTKFALTGAVFAKDDKFIELALEKFKMAAGNFYINDKSTGSVVGQQPFGGGRLSGTNDKAGSPYYILRWTSPQSIKETFVPQTDIYYPYMALNQS